MSLRLISFIISAILSHHSLGTYIIDYPKLLTLLIKNCKYYSSKHQALMLSFVNNDSSCNNDNNNNNYNANNDNNTNNSSSSYSDANSNDQKKVAYKINIANKLVYSINTSSILSPTQSISLFISLLLYTSIMMIFPTLHNNINISTINNITNNFSILFPLFETVCRETLNQLEMLLKLLKYLESIDGKSDNGSDFIFGNKKDDDADGGYNNDNNVDVDKKSNRDNVGDNTDQQITDNSIEISYKMIVLLYTTIRQILYDISFMIQIIITFKSSYGGIIIITLYDHKHNNSYVQCLLNHLHQYYHTLLQIINKIYTYLYNALNTSASSNITNTNNSTKSITSNINSRSDSHTILINSVLQQLQLTKLHIKNFQGFIEGNKTKKSD